MSGAGVTITAVEADGKQKGQYRVHLEDGRQLDVHEDVLVKYRLLKGETLDASTIRRIRQEESAQEAIQQALRWLSVRARSEQELVQGLKQKGYAQKIILQAVSRCRELGMMDDRAFARQLTSHRSRIQRKGKRLIEQELKQRGIEQDDIADALAETNTQQERDNALNWIRKKWPALKGDTRVRKQKMAAFLYRKGFDSALIRDSLRAYMEEAEEADAGELDWE
ncbi:regulatory protein RecX [Xylanibacillus composti]|uniref:Regulatory protein RecX n=1 Tax=Xylanibacillus composti TaxID=1572762 RepID=A0A8J4M4A9_9BACL|nr:RecX family transcriptional regulator [Xylanibacillus composti]GIQ70987.1 regulatory protein RecX [Xylanibacillus composti]